MRVLVCAASKHGSTAEIARRIAASLADAGVVPILRDPGEVAGVAGYDAAIIGSGVYVGKWQKPARDLVRRCAEELRTRPVWLFSSGPLGDPPVPGEDPSEIAELVGLTGARGHRLFAGSLDRGTLGMGERAMVGMVKAPYGDFRPWGEITAWAAEIAESLRSAAA